ncbi:tRNA splicing endonuclease subunit sen2 [Madurella fahalii]|uniref:tRNA-intron lyase n=1 Tax=Madurella fahalii TaxID=1157608 RepID=A0ABQ0G9Z1_9PEZI
MAESPTSTAPSTGRDTGKVGELASGGVPSAVPDGNPPTSVRPAPPPRTPLNQVYTLPAPIRIFPLPSFYPNNPISLLHLAFAWLKQVLRPPPPEPSVVHVGIWDPETRSVHVRDPASIRALWEQGFYGKGSLSRSEPNWLKRELARRGSPEGKTVSEARTESRREERRLAKWERAKAELEAIERQRLAEAASHAAVNEASKPNGEVNGPPNGQAGPGALGSSVQTVAPKLVPTDIAAERTAKTAPHPEPVQLTERDSVSERNLAEAKPPVGPAELLALPNSLSKPTDSTDALPKQYKPPIGPLELLSLPNSAADIAPKLLGGKAKFEVGAVSPDDATTSHRKTNGLVNGNGHAIEASAFPRDHSMDELSINKARPNGFSNGISTPVPSSPSSEPAASPAPENKDPFKRRKSVRFSPRVQSTTFQHFDPPSPNRTPSVLSKGNVLEAAVQVNGVESKAASTLPAATPTISETAPAPSTDTTASAAHIENKEHFQLAPEEAFFLAFSVGALSVVDPVTTSPIPTEHLLRLLRSHSYFPPRSTGLRSDDPFLVNYAVYHHFRSLGWVPRHGIKFGVDWILYQRGPVFDHSEFGIMVMPAFSDPAWKEYEHQPPKRSWSWLMGVNRVLSHVLKSLVLVYVDIPPPEVFDEAMQSGGIAAALKKYTIREVMVRRFSVNRNR